MKKFMLLPLLFCSFNLYADYQNGNYYPAQGGSASNYNQPYTSTQSNMPQSQGYGSSQGYYGQPQTAYSSSQNMYNQPQGSYGPSQQGTMGYGSSQGYYGQPNSQGMYNQGGYSSQGDRSMGYGDNYNRSNTSYAEKYPRDTYATPADQDINMRIRKKFSGWFSDDYKDIMLHTDNGMVTIDGYVDSENDRQKLTDKIRKIEGVRNISNNTQVKR